MRTTFLGCSGVVLCLLSASVWAQADSPVAIVAGQEITEAELQSRAQVQLRQLRNQEYEIKRRALDDLIGQKLLETEAKKRELTADELIEKEAAATNAEPTEAELQAFYLGQRERLGNRPLSEVKDQMRASLKQARLQQARQDYMQQLRARSEVTILLRPPKVELSYDPQRLRGNPKAPVTIVEFSDFQCPYCGAIQNTLRQVMAKYGDRVSLAFRDFPLRQIHPQAELAAEASHCAEEQGKFWEYHDALFADQSKLDKAGLVERARGLKLDDKSFESCLTGGKYSAQVERDLQDGMQAGVNGTPSFFINGIFLNGAQPVAAFENNIDNELKSRK